MISSWTRALHRNDVKDKSSERDNRNDIEHELFKISTLLSAISVKDMGIRLSIAPSPVKRYY